MAKLIRTAFLIGLAVTWRPDAAAGQYSWSNFSVSVGFGTGGAGFGVGASYAAVDPFYDVYYEDPCWDYAYYESYRHACSRGYDGIHIRQNYSVVSLNRYRRPGWPRYYSPYGYYGYPSHTHFSVSFGLNFGYGYPFSFYGSHYYTPVYSAYGYPAYGYGYPAYGYGHGHGYGYGYGYGYPAYGVVRFGGSRNASTVIRPAPAYRGSPLVRSSPVYKESPQLGGRSTSAASSLTSRTAAATRSPSDGRARALSTRAEAPDRSQSKQRISARRISANPTPSDGTRMSRAQTPRERFSVTGRRSTRVRPSDAVSRGGADRTDGLRARRGTSTRLYPPSRATTSRRPTSSSDRASATTRRRSAPTPSGSPERSSRALETGRPGTQTPSTAAPRPTAQSRSGTPRPTARSRSGGITRKMSMRERAPATRSAPSARARTSGPSQPKTASPSRSRPTQPSARSARTRTPPRAPAARRAPPTRSAAPRATTPRSRASLGGASRGAARARATRPARSGNPRR